MYEEQLNDYIKQLREQLTGSHEAEVITINDIDCSMLDAPLMNEAATDVHDYANPPFNGESYVSQTVFWNKIPPFDPRPALYIFELEDGVEMAPVFDAIRNFRAIQDSRRTPSHFIGPRSSTVLYVGKTKNDIGGRISVHLGYGEKPIHHGLQLLHWAKDVRPAIKLKVTLILFKEGFDLDLLHLLEKKFHKSLKPRIGRC